MSGNSNTLTLTIEVDDKGSLKVKQFAGGIDAAGKQVDDSSKGMVAALGNLEGVIKKVVAAWALFKVADFVRDSTMAAARFETLGVVLDRLSRNASYTTAELKGFEQGLRETGIAGIEARAVLAQMIQSNLDLSKSTELARVAQDASVVANLNSSETLERMMHAIQANSVEIVRTIGLQVSFEDATKRMAAQLGKTVEQLTEGEKTQARLNATIQAGAMYSGAYEAAMGTAAKQINSFKRFIQDFEIAFGQAFNPALTANVSASAGALKTLTETVKDPQFQTDMTKMANDLSKGLVDGMKWLVENRENVKGFFVGISTGLSAIASVMAKLPPEAWGALLGYKVAGPYGAGVGLLGGLTYRMYGDVSDRRKQLEAEIGTLNTTNRTLMTGIKAGRDDLTEWYSRNQQVLAGLRKEIEAMSYVPLKPGDKGFGIEASIRQRMGANAGFGGDPERDPLSKEAQAATNRFILDYRKTFEGEIEWERAKLEAEYKNYDKHVRDKAALNEWYAAEKRKLDIKEFAQLQGTDFGGFNRPEESEARRFVRDPKQSIENAARYQESLYGQGTNWKEADRLWADYLNGIEKATRANEIFNDTMNVMSQSSANAFAGFVTGTKSAKDAFLDLTQSVIAGLARMSTQKFAEEIFGSISKFAGAYLNKPGWQPAFDPAVGPMAALGAVFGPSGMYAFARGGVVDRPTLFRFARGTGLMGEAGPEGILPLKRNSRGELGVTTDRASAPGIQLVINNNAPVDVTPREEFDPSGFRRMVVDIVASDITLGGDVARAHSHMFGTRPVTRR